MSRRKPRALTPEERALWNKVARRTSRMHPDRPEPKPADFLHSDPAPRPSDPIPAFRLGEKTTQTAAPPSITPGLSDRQASQPVQMDRKHFNRLKRGKLRPQARIDLHGMTLDRAHPALTRFILDAHADGLRLVLVITGKGKDRNQGGPIPVRRGVLKHQVPHWLRTPPLSHVVMQVAESHIRHGGEGAFYVYLRRQR